MKISFGDHNTLEEKGLDVADTDTKIPIGPQFNMSGEFNPTGKTKLFIQIFVWLVVIAVGFLIVKLFILR